MPDSITYYRVAGLDPNSILPLCENFRYPAVFLFERLPLQAEGCRSEDDNTASFLESQLGSSPGNDGYGHGSLFATYLAYSCTGCR